jgi:putative tricarboxylic transport membrane protein
VKHNELILKNLNKKNYSREGITMKRRLAGALLTGTMVVSMLAGCGGSNQPAQSAADTSAAATEAAESEAAAETKQESASSFKPSTNITFNVSSKAGGNSDLITRTMTDIASKEGLVDQPFVIVNNTDGGGNIIRISTHDTNEPDHTLLCFSSGDMQNMLDSEIGLTVDDFAPIAIMAADKQLIFAQKDGKFASFDDIKAAIDNGEKINVGGTKSNEKTVFDMFVEEIGAADSFNYMFYDSSAESITALMGGHIDLCMGSPAAAVNYVESGDIKPVVALSDERFNAPLDEAPTMEELGYNTVQSPMWRGVIAPGSMSEEAQEYWNGVFKAVTETDAWQDYLNTYLLSPYFQDLDSTREIMKKAQDDYLASK